MTQTRTAFIAIVGCPNVGKSSIPTACSVRRSPSPKPQTTRTKIMGVLTEDEVQPVFTDTPASTARAQSSAKNDKGGQRQHLGR